MVFVHDPSTLSGMSEQRRKVQQRKRDNFLSARNVARQMTISERKTLLIELGYSEAEASKGAERDDLSGIRATGARRDRVINAFKFYPRTPTQRAKYAAEQAAHPTARDIRVRAHEKRLREKGFRRPLRNPSRREVSRLA